MPPPPRLLRVLTIPSTVRDVTAIRTQWGGIGEVVISSAYMDRNYACPPEEMRQLVSYCETNGLPLVIGSDTNAHHTMWGSTNINSRGAQLLDYIGQVDLHPINRGHRATFVVSNKKEVLDVTFVSSHLLDRIKAWWVDDNESCSDHRYIRTSLSLGPPDPIIYRDRKRTRWDLYKSVLKGLTELDPARACPMSSTEEIEASASRVSNFIHKSYDVACPEKVLKSRRKRVPWWSRELTSLRKEARRLYRVARFGGEEAWAEYKAARNYYSYEMRRRKTASWRRFCESVEEAPVAARLSRILRNDGTIKLGSLDKGDGVYTRTLSDTYELLLDQSFPRDPQRVPWEPDHSKVDDESINLMITSSKISNIINSFGPLKAAGKDGIFPALSQHGLAELIPYLVPLMRGCLTFGYTPLKWRESRVEFLPKPGMESYERASAWRPICLTSFLLKTLEKLVDGWVRTPDLVDRLQRHSQYAYMKGVSTEAALHQIVSLVEGALDSGEYCIAVMLDVRGAFNEVRSDTIIRSLRRFGVNEVCVRYIEHMLRTRTTWVTDSTYEIGRVVERGCPQGGVLSPLLWDLVASEILEKLHHRFPQLYSQGFADDLTTVGRGIDLGTVGSHEQRAVNLVSDWCKEVRYLGVLLDHKLNWGSLCRARALKGMRALAQCRRAIGKTWGLSPKITNWIYKSIIRPAMEYGSLLWAPATKIFLDLPKLEEKVGLEEWLNRSSEEWTSNARHIAKSWIREGLKERCITRDLEKKWGTPVPIDKYKDKVFYVWFDAPIGYISMTKCYTKDYWKAWWMNSDAEIDIEYYQFMGKDNVPFHSILFPASLRGTKDPWTPVRHIMATEYLNYEGGKFSKSRGVGVFGNDAIQTGIPADIWRFYLIFIRPETQDSAFSWKDFMRKNNSELLNNLGNFINRSLTFLAKFFNSIIPPMNLNDDDFRVVAEINREISEYVKFLEACKLKDGLRKILAVSRIGNVYFQTQQPWTLSKNEQDLERFGTICGLGAQIVFLLMTLMEPFLPSVSRKIREQLNVPKPIFSKQLVPFLSVGHELGKVSHLFKKLEADFIGSLKKKYVGQQQPGEA
ncbi:Methionine--tRNA ligase, cytoplasmic [Folsomia candida]|uniref:methionine--tRNA ligase n=1 Tax=Folsomia candida TaxID=158441 RepID=A0A226DJB2_FOLCA|nr:Methionine--tRNA ligase, cytoplasmic [Folsomia candida]